MWTALLPSVLLSASLAGAGDWKDNEIDWPQAVKLYWILGKVRDDADQAEP